MRALVAEDQAAPLRVVELNNPEPAKGEVVLSVEACGICGSDLHLVDALALGGVVLGHEFCGTVADVGEGVEDWEVGDRATALSLATCGTCTACRTGWVRRCPNASMVGIERPGAYAQYVAVPAHDLWALPDTVDARTGALVEPLAVALHSVERATLAPGEDAVVLGAGPVGLAVALWLRRLGAREVIVSDPAPGRRALAERVGATATVDPTREDVTAAVVARTGAPPPVVIECVGIPGLIQHATDVAAVGGRVVVAGVCMAPDSLMPFTPMAKELDLRFSFYYRTSDYRTTIHELASGGIDAEPLITAEVGLDDTPDAFDALKQPGDDCKVLIRPW